VTTTPPDPDATTTAPSTTEPPPPPPPDPPVNGVSNAFAAQRLSFGGSPALSAEIERLGAGGWINDQLSKTQADPAVEARFPGDSIVNRTREQIRGTNFRISLTHSVLFRARYSSHQLYELMASLWADHFNIHLPGGNREIYTPDYQEKVIRPNAMGRFADLLLATAQSEGMMWYLDNHLSDARKQGGVNENYGRELLELHTVGVDNHSEADVVGAAKILSGWTITGRYPGQFGFNAAMHANETVTVLGRQFAAGTGQRQGVDLLDFLAHHPNTARMVATKICRRFVSDQPPSDLIGSAAQVYLDNDTNIVPVLRHVLASSAFADSAGEKLRRPFEFMVACLRATDATVGRNESSQLFSILGDMGNRPWWWIPPNGFPDFAAYWADTSGFLLRWSFAARLCHNRLNDVSTNVAGIRSQAGSAGAYVEALARRFGLESLPTRDVDGILQAYGLDRNSAAGSIGQAEAGDIAALVLCHPSFQLR